MFTEPPRCQLHNRLSALSFRQWLQLQLGAIRHRLHLGTRWRRMLAGAKGIKPAANPARLGEPSRYAAGSWVRVVDARRVFLTLNAKKQLRGLLWVWQQWPYCGTVHQVFKPVRRMMDDAYAMRAVSGTVLLDTSPCGGPLGQHGCGRDCPLMFRDEWLEPAEPPVLMPSVDSHSGYATVRSADDIRRTLDDQHSHRGLMFMPEMYEHVGQRFRVRRQVERVLEGGRYVPPAEPLYMLEGLHCAGKIMGTDGPCERSCRLLWHADWLHLEPG